MSKELFNKLMYENKLSSAEDITDFKLEGEAALTFPRERLRMENLVDPDDEERECNFVLWCPEDFPADIKVCWDFWPIREPGLCIIFFAAGGREGEDIFDPRLSERKGSYPQYHHGDIDAYHLSYFRRRWEDERAFHTCNLRKSYGKHMVAMGGDPIPSVHDADSPYSLELVKYQGKISFSINGLNILHWEDDGMEYGPVLQGGKIGFRQMAPLMAEYAGLKVYTVG